MNFKEILANIKTGKEVKSTVLADLINFENEAEKTKFMSTDPSDLFDRILDDVNALNDIVINLDLTAISYSVTETLKDVEAKYFFKSANGQEFYFRTIYRIYCNLDIGNGYNIISARDGNKEYNYRLGDNMYVGVGFTVKEIKPLLNKLVNEGVPKFDTFSNLLKEYERNRYLASELLAYMYFCNENNNEKYRNLNGIQEIAEAIRTVIESIQSYDSIDNILNTFEDAIPYSFIQIHPEITFAEMHLKIKKEYLKSKNIAEADGTNAADVARFRFNDGYKKFDSMAYYTCYSKSTITTKALLSPKSFSEINDFFSHPRKFSSTNKDRIMVYHS